MPYSTTKAIALRILRRIYWEALRELESGNIDDAYKYSLLMKRILIETRTRRPKWLSFCRHCGMVLVPGLSARIRLRRRGKMKYIVARCLKCGYINRFPYKHTKRESRGESRGKT